MALSKSDPSATYLDETESLLREGLVGLLLNTAYGVAGDTGEGCRADVTEVELDEQRALDHLSDRGAIRRALDLGQDAQGTSQRLDLVGGASELGECTDLDESFGVNVLLFRLHDISLGGVIQRIGYA